MKQFIAIILTLTAMVPPLAYARGTKEKLSTPTFEDKGNTRESYQVIGYVNTAVSQPYDTSEYVNRAHTIQNPDSTYRLCVATFSNFSSSITVAGQGAGFAVIEPKTSAEFTSNASFYMKWEVGGTTAAFLITREREK